MTGDIADLVLDFLWRRQIATLDITGGAPELNSHFRRLVNEARNLGTKVMDRCNLTILEQRGQEDLAEFLASECVEVVASMPCYLQDNVERQRGKGVFAGSIRGLKRLNALGYGRDPALTLNLVYNPQGPSCRGAGFSRSRLQAVLGEQYGIMFNKLYVLANMPIQRGRPDRDRASSTLISACCRMPTSTPISTASCAQPDFGGQRGYVYDCDFNQMLGLPMTCTERPRVHLADLLNDTIEGSNSRCRSLLWVHSRAGLLRRCVEEAPNSGARLSVIIPVLTKLGIEAALTALSCYRARGVEVIVVDGGSCDGTAALALSLSDRVLAAPRGP
jgi:radical SAM/Cys-rich protein